MKASLQEFITKIFTQIKNNYGNVDNTSDEDKPISIAQQAEFDKLNSNLDQLEYSEVAGGKNICPQSSVSGNNITVVIPLNSLLPAGTYTVSGKCTLSKGLGIWFDGTTEKVVDTSNTSFSLTFTLTKQASVLKMYCSGIFDVTEIQIEEGTTATPYEPYIPSVKMLAEKTTQIDDNNMLGWVVPEEMPIKNYVDSNGVFHQRVGRVDLGSLNWSYFSQNRFLASNINELVNKPTSDNEVMNGLYCNLYTKITSKNGMLDYDKSIACDDSGNIWIRNKSYTDVETLRNSLQGVYLYYELETPITKTIDGNEAVAQIKNDLAKLFSSNITGIKLNGSTLEVSFNNGTSVGKVSFEGIMEEETILS